MSSPWTKDAEAELRRLWVTEKLSAADIATTLGTTRNAVMGIVHRAGLQRMGARGPRSRVWTAENVQKLQHLWLEGHTTYTIARAFGVSRNAVTAKLLRSGLQRKGPAPQRKGPAPQRTGPRHNYDAVSAPETHRIANDNAPPPRTRRPPPPEPTKSDIRRMFEAAWRNTAALSEEPK